MSPNSAKKWKTLLQSDHQIQPDVGLDQSSESEENSGLFAHFNTNQQNSTSEEETDLFAHFNTNQQNSEHDKNSMTDTRRTRSGKIYVCLSKVVQEKDPLFLHPSLTTLNWDKYRRSPAQPSSNIIFISN